MAKLNYSVIKSKSLAYIKKSHFLQKWGKTIIIAAFNIFYWLMLLLHNPISLKLIILKKENVGAHKLQLDLEGTSLGPN